ncbi:hypothetical protein NDI56_02915 [Haloarcula sp. S1CR25-12]|uniref:Uncharacterized protein n=1 Tax=Haloarcula saliterrae TaxID=2950534 RepID=A0ABU2F7Y6_9EURY|nr:hypothetical protein [Haloarcula sp. S1CR25-12]MDS0258359.1 hypothetical protein [Haloarcula sp. S1CR25-12]
MARDTTVPRDQVEDVLDDWPDDPTAVAHTVMETYGAPNEATESRLIWFDNGPWKYSILYREGVSHEFPAQHTDYLEQAIDYAVDPDRYDDLGQFDGSVTVRRTRGELSAECHGEPANFLALNLAHDILAGEKTVGEARKAYTEIYARKEAGGRPEYVQGLKFDLPETDQRDPDEKTLTEEIKQEAEHQVH